MGKKIGQGKFGRVFEAIYRPNGVKVALKVVYKQMLDQYKFHAQMRKELEIQYRLSRHPNIVKLLGYFHDQNCVYSVQEFAPEGNLYQILRKRGHLSELEVVQIIQQVLVALCYMQVRNVIHRDIKPENILVFK